MNLVELKPLLPAGTIYDLRYARSDNIARKILYSPDFEPKLEHSAAKRLAYAARLLMNSTKGMNLKIWDAYRPMEAHLELLKACSDPRYVLDPEKSNHPKGLAVDLTVIQSKGTELDMGTDFDDFTEMAHVNAAGLLGHQRRNRQLLMILMDSAGFQQWPYEWWHFDLKPQFTTEVNHAA